MPKRDHLLYAALVIVAAVYCVALFRAAGRCYDKGGVPVPVSLWAMCAAGVDQ